MFMKTEKLVYWMAVGVLGLGALNGLMSRLEESAPKLADRSLAVVAQASQIAAGYMHQEDPTGSDEVEIVNPATIVKAEARLACAEAALARHQAAMARIQAQQLRFPRLQHTPRVITWPGGQIVIDVPEAPVLSQQSY